MDFDRSTDREESRKVNYGENIDCCESNLCPRCGGLLIFQEFMDLRDDTGIVNFYAKRCLLCGEVLDSVILKNRHVIREPERTRGPHRRIGPVPVSMKKMNSRRSQKDQPTGLRLEEKADRRAPEHSSQEPPSTSHRPNKENKS